MKRLLDVTVAAVALVVLAPVLLVLAMLVARSMGRPVVFAQRRPGLKGRPFRMYKFRTMTEERDARGAPLADEHRLTALGSWLRATSLDELPELWNVLRGDMSLVGPRPLLMQYLDRYTPEQARRHDVRPGITGYAQVNGRNELSWPERFALDTWYVDNRTLWLDIRILISTLGKVVRRDGISAHGEATMSEFIGEPDASPYR